MKEFKNKKKCFDDDINVDVTDKGLFYKPAFNIQ